MAGKKGFSGFEDLVSDVDGEISGARKEPASDTRSPESAPERPVAPQPQARPAAVEVSGAPGKITGIGWAAIGIVVAVAVAAVVSESGGGGKKAPADPVLQVAQSGGAKPVPKIAEFRKKYPEYADMSDTELADALYRKFYSDMSRQEYDLAVGVSSGLQKPAAGNVAAKGKEKAAPKENPQPKSQRDASGKDGKSEVEDKVEWLKEMNSRLSGKVPDKDERLELLKAASYEAKRAGLDPQLVLAIIDVSSNFRKYAVSADSERKGYMSVPSVWPDKIGTGQENLFHLKTNLRFGCTVFRHYLDSSDGNVKSALEKYSGPGMNGGEFARRVLAAYQQVWKYPGKAEQPASQPAYLGAPVVPAAELPRPAPRPAYCDIDFNIELETYGEGVTVELRSGVPGNSKVMSSKSSRGGYVGFSGLCPGQHFLAIGNGESVSVTPTRDFESGHQYSSRIKMQRGSGNVSSRSRGSL